MASGSFTLQWHGSGALVSGFNQAPKMYVNVSYNIYRDSSNRNNVKGSVSVSLQGLGGYSYFGYSITCSVEVVGGGKKDVFSKPNYPSTWGNGAYAGNASYNFSKTSGNTVELRIYFSSNCPCGASGHYYSRILDIGYAYTTPNIAIDSLNGVPIERGEGKYEINLNADQNITIGYSQWAGSTTADSCKIDAWVAETTDTKTSPYYGWKQYIVDDGDGKPAGSALYRKSNDASDPSNLVGSGITFDHDGEYMWLYASRIHSSYKSGNSYVRSPYIIDTNARKIKILFTPIKSVNITKQPDKLITSKSDIQISWEYPESSSLINQNGIVSGYEIRLIRESDGLVEFSDTTLYNNYTLLKNNYKALRKYYIQIVPYYEVDSTRKSYGPVKNTDIFQLISELSEPTINYPKTDSNCVWIGNNFYILAQLPEDVDYYDLENKSEYFYKDIEININNISYKYSTNKSKFSITSLTHNSKFVFTTKGLNIPLNTSYVIKVRVQKNYGIDGEYKWSDYQVINLKSSSVPDIPVFRGYIMADHYLKIYDYISKMRNCYKPSDVSLNLNIITSKKSYILRDDYQKLYNELSNISILIDTWGEYDNQSIKTKFSSNNEFDPKIEYITDIDNDNNPVGNNYLIKSYNWIRYYK